MAQTTFYTCSACYHAGPLHDPTRTQRCRAKDDNGAPCKCTAFQAPVWQGDLARQKAQVHTSTEDLARQLSTLEDPDDVVRAVNLLVYRTLQKRYEAAGKPGWSASEKRVRLGITEVIGAAHGNIWHLHDGDGHATAGEYLRPYSETVVSDPWWSEGTDGDATPGPSLPPQTGPSQKTGDPGGA